MAQTGYTPILIYSSSTASTAPAAGNLTNSTLGSELAINITDGKLFYKDNGGSVQVIAWKTTPTTAGGTGLTSYTAGDLLYYATGTTLSKLAIGASTTILTSSGTAPQWSAASGITVGTATNIAGGAAGSVPYQTGAGATSLLAIGTAYYQLGVNAGGTAPAWQPSATSVLTTQGDLLYASAANTLARLAKNTTASRYLSNSGTSNNPAWAQIDLTNGVTGTLPVGNGGTGTATAFTAGSVLFAGASGVYLQNNANFFWDNTNKYLGLGTTTPVSVLELQTSAPVETISNNANVSTTTGTVYSKVAMRSLKGAGAGAFAYDDAWIQTERANVNYNGDVFTHDTKLVLYVNGSNRDANPVAQVSIDVSNVNLLTGNLVPTVAGKGINFTANSAAAGKTSQLLNYYEEGTWTPTDQSGASLTFTGASGTYTRVGNQIKASFTLTYPSTASGVQNYISLPISSNGGGGMYVTYTNYGSAICGYVDGTNTRFVIVDFSGNALTNANLSGKRIDGVVIYRAA